MTFEVLPMLPRTLAWWLEEIDSVDFEPVYQRKGQIWSVPQKQLLIDSILNKFDIPKLYLADFTFLNSRLNASKKRYAVIDGKQRLLAISDFFSGQFTLAKDFSLSEQPELELGGFSYRDLESNYPKIAKKFDNYSLSIMSVITDDESKINDLFVRLNSSKPLTGAELRGAMTGNVPNIIKSLAGHEFFKTRIKFNTARSQDRNMAAKLLLLEHRGSIVDTKKQQLDKLIKEGLNEIEGQQVEDSDQLEGALEEVFEETENLSIERSADRTNAVLSKMRDIFIENDPLLRQQAQIVVIYWLVRSIEEDELAKVRPFLLKFEADRAANKEAGGTQDSELAEFELQARTSNDASSIRERYNTVLNRFLSF